MLSPPPTHQPAPQLTYRCQGCAGECYSHKVGGHTCVHAGICARHHGNGVCWLLSPWNDHAVEQPCDVGRRDTVSEAGEGDGGTHWDVSIHKWPHNLGRIYDKELSGSDEKILTLYTVDELHTVIKWVTLVRPFI